MNGLDGLVSSHYGFKPQGKSAPMAAQKPNKSSANSKIPFNFAIGGSEKPTPSSNLPIFDDRKSSPNDVTNLGFFNDGFSRGRSKATGASDSSSANVDNIFGGRGGDSGPGHGFSSLPVFDKPVYDDEDLSSAKYEDIFSSSSSSAKKAEAFDDLLEDFAREKAQAGSGSKGPGKASSGFDDLLPGFGSVSAASLTSRNTSDAAKETSHVASEPFVVLESTSTPAPSSSAIFNDPLEETGNLNNSDKRKVKSTTSGGVFDDLDPLVGFGKSVPAFAVDMNGRPKDESPLQTGTRAFERQTSENGYVSQKSSFRSPERGSSKKMHVDDYRESPQSVFEMPSVSGGSHRSVQNASPPAYRSSDCGGSNTNGHTLSDENVGASDDVWLTVSEVPLFTQPTAAPPPLRPPPPRPAWFSKAESRSFPVSNAQKKGGEYSSSGASVPPFHSRKSEPAGERGSFASPIDELVRFATGRNRSNVDGSSDVPAGEDFETNSVAAAAMKEAMAKAEAKFRQVRGAKERENARASRSREAVQTEKEELIAQDSQERKFNEHQERLEHERRQREKNDEEKRRREEEEKRRTEREQEQREREKRRIEREREFARQAVDRAAREARERAAAEARARAERASVQKAQAEARERAERAAVQRAQAEARERAAAEAKERAEKAAVEARERARAEAREKEARERAAAAAAARANQQKNENDLESFFGTGARARSAPRPGSNSSDSPSNFQSKPAAEATRASVNSSSNMKKASSSTNIVDDLSSIFGGPPSSGEFQEVEGESEERRRARLERHQRTQERAAKALAEKNARDLEAQREQAERHRIAETLDVEIKRWSAGKEGNLRALLSTLQYVLWPECGWQPVSLTDLITAAAVKKVYRKATLCIHPDKVQQKGATLQQKYIAEKVFDLLKEAWNKFNSEELF